MMKLFVITFLLAAVLTKAGEWTSDVVECSSITKAESHKKFTVCAVASFITPEFARLPNGTGVRVGGYTNEYNITIRVRKGTKLSDLDAEQRRLANAIETSVKIRREEGNMCKVVVTVRGNATRCSSCTFCGGAKYSANCLNVAKGRNVNCESVDTGKVFFPLMQPALRVVHAPTRQTKAPVKPRAPTAPRAVPVAPKSAPV